MPRTHFEEGTFISEHRIRQELNKETGLVATLIDCCANGCMAFTGTYSTGFHCVLCKRARWRQDSSGKRRPFQTFAYISPVHRLRAMWRDKIMSEHLLYRTKRTHDPNLLEDIFDGTLFQDLQRQKVTWGGIEAQPSRKYFEEETDIALGLGTDGIPLFSRSPVDCWPLVLTNYSMPDYLRSHKEHQICCGLILGRKDKRFANAANDNTTFMMDTFLQPLIDDPQKLATEGFEAVRWKDNKLVTFTMRAHLLIVTGDMPAISKVMHFKGTTAKTPCRCCNQQSTPTANKRTITYYPSHANGAADADIRRYLNLSLRDNKETKLTEQWLLKCDNAAERTHVQVEMGINGESILYAIDSISFPWSFPVDIMHVLFENIMKALLSSWAGTYKMGNITEGDQERLKDDFIIGDRTAVWKAMSREVAGSNGLVPSSIASRVQDLDARGWWTVETHCYFLLFLGPIVLKNRLQKQYFLHFLRLSDITRTMTKIEIKTEELEGLRRKIAQWVLDYER